MIENKFETELYCIDCLGQSLHTVVYVNDVLYKVTCESCGKEHVIKPDLPKEIYVRYVDRILSKPKRITKEFREDLSHFLSSLPFRLLSKPYRTYNELRGIFRYVHKQSARKEK
ncbi:hypothetical protein LOK74_07715 [Brevibacillus humidisoli]|uniref:hypothetical protein n=1 Tax=Brevibacillus humidisoli TaxID=2895522 RepID=UPI001E370772|nr:hypothetical protein [Brevibacillus humidisoli]UFJ42363.1 hypothetical protein LOK74_07715 [Brevibacillus humidisoli]